MAKPVINIILADDHALFRKGLLFLLGQEADLCVVAEASDGLQAIKLAAHHRPDIVLLDLNMPVMNGLEALAQIRQQQPELPVLILTVAEEVANLRKCLSLNACGYILKSADSDFLIAAIRQAVQGGQVVSAEMTTRLLENPNAPADTDSTRLNSLSQREQEVLQHLAQGCSNKRIAMRLLLSENTVKVHVQNILKKLNLHSRVQAALFASEHGPGKSD